MAGDGGRTVAVIDTNVVVIGLLTRDPSSPTAQIVERMLLGRTPFVLSVELVGEFRTVLLRAKIARRHKRSPAEIDQLLTDLIANAIMHSPPKARATAPDPKDAHIWALAHARPGAIVVTGDQLLIDRPPRGVTVLSPRDFLERHCRE